MFSVKHHVAIRVCFPARWVRNSDQRGAIHHGYTKSAQPEFLCNAGLELADAKIQYSTVLTKHNACDRNQLLKSSGQKIFLPTINNENYLFFQL